MLHSICKVECLCHNKSLVQAAGVLSSILVSDVYKQAGNMTSPSAIVVGGGLAGMVVARELAVRGWRVIF